MYEFINRNGERVSVRSARTLVMLLSEGSIKGETPFRRAEEPAYVAAAGHAELGRIAKDAGMLLVSPPAPEPTPPSKPAPPEIQTLQSILRAPAHTSSPAVPISSIGKRDPVKGEDSPWTSKTALGPMQPRPLTATPTAPRPPPPSALALALQPHRAGWRVLVVILHYLGMAAAGVTGGAVVGGVTGSVVLGGLSAILLFLASAHGAGRLLATRRAVPPGWEALLATALVCGTATAVGGFGGLVLSVVAGAILWRALKSPKTHRT